MSSLFITGSSGFIGTNLVRKLEPAKYDKIYCLARKKPAGDFPHNFEFIKGCICDTESYAGYLESCETVVHLAAATGKATPSEYFKVNTQGTERLLEQSERSGVKNFLYVSSIAAKFADKSSYYYAQSKEQGEQAVRKSSLNYAIVRPTIVLGKDSTILKALAGLAQKPILLIFGDGQTRIQPIFVEDLIDCLLKIVDSNCFSNETFELGGPEEITFEHLLTRIHRIYRGKDPSVIHIPIKLLTATIAFLEKWFYSILPINAGQLSAFNNDGTVEMNRLYSLAAPQMQNVNSMLQQVLPARSHTEAARTLERECIKFSSYLIDEEPTSYVIDKYVAAHAVNSYLQSREGDRFDQLLTRMATANALTSKLVDCYTSLFSKTATVRKKWVMLLAILESSSPSHLHFDTPDSNSRARLLMKMTWQGVGFLIFLALSIVILTPLRVILWFSSLFTSSN